MSHLLKPIWTKWLAYFGFWTLFAFFFISENAAPILYQGRGVDWRAYLIVWLTTAYAWALLAPGVWFLARRFSIERPALASRISLHLIAGIGVALLEEALFALVTPVFGLPWFKRAFWATFRAVLPIDFHLNLIIYWLIVGAYHAVDYYRKYRERERFAAQLELRASALQNQLTQATLTALQMQLHPHFLFNTLNAIVVLVRKQETQAADEMLTNLGELLQRTLENEKAQKVPLRQEIDYLQLYLDIQKVRFQDRLTIKMALAPETLNALVPTFLLQPLVENAFQHGIAKKASPGTLELKSHKVNSALQIQVCDDGPGIPPQGPKDGGVGLKNTRARLRELYQERQALHLENSPKGGAIITVVLPYHLAEEQLAEDQDL